jgi:hypothetical protein
VVSIDLLLATVFEERIDRVIGRLTGALMQKGKCLSVRQPWRQPSTPSFTYLDLGCVPEIVPYVATSCPRLANLAMRIFSFFLT